MRPDEMSAIAASLKNDAAREGFLRKVWDPAFLMQLQLQPTASLLTALENGIFTRAQVSIFLLFVFEVAHIPKVLAVPQVLFPILDPLYEAVVDGFVRLDSDAYNGKLEVITVSFKMTF